MGATLVDLRFGDSAQVVALSGQDALCCRLTSLGFLPGIQIKLISKLPFGGPVTVDILGGRVALSREDAQTIQVVAVHSTTQPAFA